MDQFGSSDHDQQQRRGVFDVDETKALAALELAWAPDYDQFWVWDGRWGAHPAGTPDSEAVTGSTADELTVNLRADAARRSAP
jgi:hypothetical protein